jgi:adenine-specific DNA-methyltransferase
MGKIIREPSCRKTEGQILSKFENVCKSLGLFFTPDNIIDLMVEISKFTGGKVLEPACGLGQFLSRLAERLVLNKPGNVNLSACLLGVEMQSEIANKVNEYVYSYLLSKSIKGNYGEIPVLIENYLLSNLTPDFDLIIGNPPYGIMGQHRHYSIPVTKSLKEKYKRMFRTWHGKYNIYGVFIEKSVNLLKKGGKLVYIIPATWMILDEFKYLREFLAYNGKVVVYYLGSKVFKSAQVCTVILELRKGDKGLELWDFSNGKRELIISENKYQGEIIRFETDFTRSLEKNGFQLGSLFDIFISAGSPEARGCCYVSREKKEGMLPLLNGRNVKPFKILYNENHSGYWIEKERIGDLKHFYKKERLVVGHTKGGKIITAIDKKRYPWIGDVYHLIPKDNLLISRIRLEMQDLVYILNSELMNKYVKTLYREITPHITATQLKLLPLYPIRDWRQMEVKYAEIE